MLLLLTRKQSANRSGEFGAFTAGELNPWRKKQLLVSLNYNLPLWYQNSDRIGITTRERNSKSHVFPLLNHCQTKGSSPVLVGLMFCVIDELLNLEFLEMEHVL